MFYGLFKWEIVLYFFIVNKLFCTRLILVTHTDTHTYIHTHTHTRTHTHNVTHKHSLIHPYRLCGIHHHVWIRILTQVMSPVSDPGSEPGSKTTEPGSKTTDPGSKTTDPGSKTTEPGSKTDTTKANKWFRWSLLHWFFISSVCQGFYAFSCIFTLYTRNKNKLKYYKSCCNGTIEESTIFHSQNF